MNLASTPGREEENVAAADSIRHGFQDERRQHMQMHVEQLRGQPLQQRSSSMPPPSNRKPTVSTEYHADDNFRAGQMGKILASPPLKTINLTTTTTMPTTRSCHESLQTISTEDVTEVSETDASFDLELLPVRSSNARIASSISHNMNTDATHIEEYDDNDDDDDDASINSQAKSSSSDQWQGIDEEDDKFDTQMAMPFDEADVVSTERLIRDEVKQEEDYGNEATPAIRKEPSIHRREADVDEKTSFPQISLQKARYGEEKLETCENTVVMIDHSMGEKDLKIATYNMTAGEKGGRGDSKTKIVLVAQHGSHHDDDDDDDLELGGDILVGGDRLLKADMGSSDRVIKGSSRPRLGQRRERVRSEAMRLASLPGAEYVRGRAPGQIPSWILQSYRASSVRLQEEMRDQSSRSNFSQGENQDEVAADANAVLPRVPVVEDADCAPVAGVDKGKKVRRCFIAVLLFVVVATAIGVGVGISLRANATQTQHQAPGGSQQTTGPAIYYNIIACDAVNRTASSTQPNILSQCFCEEKIHSFSAQMKERYVAFQQMLTEELIWEGFNETVTSCSPSNIALWFLAEDEAGTTNVTKTLAQRYVLALHFLSMNGGTWYNASGWFSSLPECEWYGIGCNADGQVNSMGLSTNNLTGSLPSAIGLLTTMQTLDLSANYLRGVIPTQIASLSRLDVLDLSYNELSGTLPAEVNQLVALQSMHLSFNGIRGTLPTLSGLAQLSSLQVTDNKLTGMLPAREGFPDNLESISLDKNMLTGSLRSFQGMNKLLLLTLNNNTFASEDLTASFWANLTQVQTLTLGYMQLHGPVAGLFQNLKSLVAVDLTGNNFTGTLPTEIGELQHLDTMLLSGNQLRGQIPTEVGLCTKAVHLDFSSNRFVGKVPTELEQLSKLAFLYFNDNDLSGTIPIQVCNLRSFAMQDLEANCIMCPPTDCCNYCTR